MAVLGLLGFQFLHPRHQLRDLRPQGGVLDSEGGNLLSWRHASTLLLLRKFA